MDRAEALREAVREAWDSNTANDITTDLLRALVEAGGVTWEMAEKVRAHAWAQPEARYGVLGQTADFLADLLTAAGVKP